MEITLLCNAGLAITCEGYTLLVDLPNRELAPYYRLPDAVWQEILSRNAPYMSPAGIFITHDHPDHCDRDKVALFRKRWPQVPVFLPESAAEEGTLLWDPFSIRWKRVDHAPMDIPTPPHVVTWIEARGHTIYLAADARPDPEDHRNFLRGRVADVAFWNSMYLSRAETRKLLADTAKRSYIYHMPPERPDPGGMWKKCFRNFQRFGHELQNVVVLERYPTSISLP